MHVDCGSVGARRVLKAEDGVITDFAEQCHGVFEVFVGFAGEADDDVGAEGDVAAGCLGPGNALEIPIPGVLALHGAQDVGRAGLHGEMDVVAERWDGVDDVDDVLGEVAGVRGREAHSADAVDLADGSKEFSKAAFATGVFEAVYVLAEELDFGEALLRDHLRFGEHGGGSAGAFLTSRIRHNAVGAEFVAAFDDGDVATVRVGARGELGVERLVCLAVVQAGDAGLACFKAGEHGGKIAVACRTGDHGNVGSALEDFVALLLCNTAEDGELFAFAVHLFVLVEAVEDLLLRFIADGAGVVKDQASVDFVGNLSVAFAKKGSDNFFGIVRVHLAAEGFDVKGLTHTIEYILPLLRLHGKATQSPERVEPSESSYMVAARLDLAE